MDKLVYYVLRVNKIDVVASQSYEKIYYLYSKLFNVFNNESVSICETDIKLYRVMIL